MIINLKISSSITVPRTKGSLSEQNAQQVFGVLPLRPILISRAADCRILHAGAASNAAKNSMTTDNLWVPNGSFRPRRYRPEGLDHWSGHLAFASDLIGELKPAVLVELGTNLGESYFGFCQAVAEHNVPCSCYAVDTWRGEAYSGG